VVYKGLMTWHNGWFTRSNEQWAKIVSKWPNMVVYDNDGMLDGYLMSVSTVTPDGERRLNIKEFFAGDPQTYQGLLAWLAAQDVDVIEYMAPADTALKHSLVQPEAYQAQNREWIFSDLCQVTPGPMARIINLAKALTTRFYTRGVSGERVLKVIDPLIPENEAPLVFRLVDGRAETRPADEGASPQIEADITTLSEMLCGYLSAADARRVGRLATDEDTALWLDRIIEDTPLFIQGGDWF
jgi:predicted acetyltransferase